MLRNLVLLLLALSSLARATPGGDTSACKSNQKNIATALEMYSTDFHGVYPGSLASLTPNYLKTIPTCPAAGLDAYSDSYRMAKDPYRYGFCCLSGRHPGHPRNYPAYSSSLGMIEQPDPAEDLEQCKSAMKDLVATVMVQNEQRPAIEHPTSPTCGGTPYLVCHRRDGSVIIECESMAHLAVGVAPLHPRYDSRQGGFDQDRLPVEEPSEAPWKMILAVVSVVCLLMLVGSKLR
ncbi:MAG: hypothetical protein KC910_32775 [Candidatus Eremiobacteraeota bacterium]|nr:hypothetical protein [Candidatus Eremiobacteraeota bacterium]